jgi:hypothetical protein
LALASLGKSWFDSATGRGLENFEQTSIRLASFQTSSRWWESAQEAGEQIGLRWRRLPVQINLDAARAPGLSMQAADVALASAVGLSRLLPAAFREEVKINAAMERRLWQTRALLASQTRRTIADHWFAFDPEENPYFQFAGVVYNGDVLRFSKGDASMEETRALQRQLEAPATLTASGPAQTSITSQLRLTIPYSLAPVAGATIPAGDAVVWIESNGPVALLEPSPNRRLIRPVGGRQRSASLDCIASSSLVETAESDPAKAGYDSVSAAVTFRGLYRGQLLALGTNVQITPAADRIDRKFPPPSTASLAVRTTASVQERFGASRASLAIVLDCSGSMGRSISSNRPRNTPRRRKRCGRCCAALRKG